MSIDKIFYPVNWGPEKEKAWSGTFLSLYDALKKYVNITDMDIPMPFWMKPVSRLLLEDAFTLSYRKLSYDRKKNCNVSFPLGSAVLQFEEIFETRDDLKTYIYQDMSVSYLEYMRQNEKDIYQICGYKRYRLSTIKKRLRTQNSYYAKCAGIFTMGYWMKDFLLSQGVDASKIHAVGGGTNIDASAVDYSKKKGNKVLFIGRNFIRKGGFLVIDAFKLLRQKNKDVELYVCGPLENPVKESIPGYHFMGDLSYPEISEMLNLCDVFCMPSYFEAYGLVFVEALIYGLPCIGRARCEMPYFIEDGITGRLLKQDDPVELSLLMEDVLNHKEYFQNVKEKKDWYIKTYSWDSVAREMVSIMNK